jgi:N-acetylglucosaminyl-diphospho-decaprenol L-rhamnosyltransferase
MGLDISIIIVTFNSALCIRECLDSLLRQQGVRFEVLLVDNASTDSTIEVVRAYDGRVRLFANQENIGFGRGCNQGFSASQGRFVFMLNPDASLTGKDSLAELCRAMERHPQWGLAGTRVTEPDGSGDSWPSPYYPDQHHVRCEFSRLPGKIAWVLGASMFIRREVFATVEGFDPGFFLTSEETDLCLRIRQQGWEIGFIPEVVVKHIGFASEQGCDPYQTSLRRVRGIFRFWSKHYPAEDVLKLVRRDRLRAGFRQRWYGALACLQGPDSTAWRKHRQYLGISVASRQFLAQPFVLESADPAALRSAGHVP